MYSIHLFLNSSTDNLIGVHSIFLCSFVHSFHNDKDETSFIAIHGVECNSVVVFCLHMRACL